MSETRDEACGLCDGTMTLAGPTHKPAEDGWPPMDVWTGRCPGCGVNHTRNIVAVKDEAALFARHRVMRLARRAARGAA